ncbi:hypothetical protein J8273_5395 [Carpediemonas membranifera]|uniref:B30.2/SPRY domain-containing protein n=1 Tax=Carpediemonas membranifera TaxID=201153 RepID=A0A8J6AU04_9EUKA|nr:hypothetical protein J8273_5395 [Carpediemonas membranifera]|eukprot:KAG9392405.1 hypothetical protein J8273_5395 [Carpediemonas membranifera]
MNLFWAEEIENAHMKQQSTLMDVRDMESSLFEDRFLVRTAEAIQVEENRYPSAKELTRLYMQRRNAASGDEKVLFRRHRKVSDVLRRLQTLRGQRPECAFLDADGIEVEDPGEPDILPREPPLLYRLLAADDGPAPPEVVPEVHDKNALKAEIKQFGSEKLSVELNGEGGRTTLVTRSRPAIAESKFLEMHAAAWDTHEKGQQTIVLDEALFSRCQHPDMPHFTRESVERFLLFCRHPNIIADTQGLKDDLQKEEQKRKQYAEQLQKELSKRRTRRLAYLQRKKTQELENLDSRVRAAMALEMERIRQKYAAIRQLESATVNRRYDQVLKETKTFFEDESAELSGLVTRVTDVPIAAARRSLESSRQVLQTVFEPTILPTLLLTAEALQAERFREGTIKFLAENYRLHRQSGVFGSCQLISPATVRQFVTSLNDTILSEMANDDSTLIAKPILEREVHYRRCVLEETFQSWPNEKITAAINAPGQPHKDLLLAVLKKRRAPAVAPTGGTHMVAVTGVEVVARHVRTGDAARRRYVTVTASRGRTQRHLEPVYFGALVRKLHQFGTLAIGVSDPADEGKRLMWQQDGILLGDGTRVETGLTFKQGDTVGLSLDPGQRQLTFYLNGQVAEGSITLQQTMPAMSAVTPTCLLYDPTKPGEGPGIDVEFQFDFPMRFPPPGGHFTWDDETSWA